MGCDGLAACPLSTLVADYAGFHSAALVAAAMKHLVIASALFIVTLALLFGAANAAFWVGQTYSGGTRHPRRAGWRR